MGYKMVYLPGYSSLGGHSYFMTLKDVERPVWLPCVKFDSCNNLLSSVHTILVNILRYASVYYYYRIMLLYQCYCICNWLNSISYVLWFSV